MYLAVCISCPSQGGSKVGSSAFKDLWIHGLSLFVNLLTMGVGLFQVLLAL
jgi:hypothetical protein